MEEEKKEAQIKLEKFCLNPSKEYLLSVEEYNTLSPYLMGFCCYMQASWKESKIEDVNPFVEVDEDWYNQFNEGSQAASIDVL